MLFFCSKILFLNKGILLPDINNTHSQFSENKCEPNKPTKCMRLRNFFDILTEMNALAWPFYGLFEWPWKVIFLILSMPGCVCRIVYSRSYNVLYRLSIGFHIFIENIRILVVAKRISIVLLRPPNLDDMLIFTVLCQNCAKWKA